MSSAADLRKRGIFIRKRSQLYRKGELLIRKQEPCPLYYISINI